MDKNKAIETKEWKRRAGCDDGGTTMVLVTMDPVLSPPSPDQHTLFLSHSISVTLSQSLFLSHSFEPEISPNLIQSSQTYDN